MVNYRNCKKFVVFLDKNLNAEDKDRSWFHLVDIDTWNNEHSSNEIANYNEKIYEALEDLGYDCRYEGENCFSVAKTLETVDELDELIDSLPYIKAISGTKDEFVDSMAMPSYDDYHKRMVNMVLKYKRLAPKRVYVDEIIDRFRQGHLVTRKIAELRDLAEFGFVSHAEEKKLPYQQIYHDITGEKDDVHKCEAFIVKQLSRKKVVYCLPNGEQSVRLFAFDSVKALDSFKENLSSYQKLQDILCGKEIEEDDEEDYGPIEEDYYKCDVDELERVGYEYGEIDDTDEIY